MTVVLLVFMDSGVESTELAAILTMIFLLDLLQPLPDERSENAKEAFVLDLASAFTISLDILRFLCRKALKEDVVYAKEVIRSILDGFLTYQSVARTLRWTFVKFQRDRIFDCDNFFGDMDERILQLLTKETRR